MRNPTRLLAAALLAAAVAATHPGAAPAASPGGDALVVGALVADAFVDGFDDLPLMPSLRQDPGGTVVFDSPYGRVAEARASGPATAAAILDFYRSVLPQMGWRPDATPGHWRREGETLTIDITPAGGASSVRFQVAPKD